MASGFMAFDSGVQRLLGGYTCTVSMFSKKVKIKWAENKSVVVCTF
jgi:hypothetical protein